MGNFGVARLKDYLMMSFWVLFIFIDPRIEGRVVVALDIVVSLGLLMQLYCIRSITPEGIAKIKRSDNV